MENAVEVHAGGSTVLPSGWRKVPSRSRPGGFSFENMHTGVRQAEVPTKPPVNVVNSAPNSAKEPVKLSPGRSLPPVPVARLSELGGSSTAGFCAENAVSVLDASGTAGKQNVSSGARLQPLDLAMLDPMYAGDVDVGLMSGNRLEDAAVLTSDVEPARGAEVSMSTSDACTADVILGWRKVMSKGDESISAKTDMAEVLTTALHEMSTLLATLKSARADLNGTHVMGVLQGLAAGSLPVGPAPALTPFNVQGTSIVLGHAEIDKTKLHVLGEAKKMVKWSDSIETVLTAAKMPPIQCLLPQKMHPKQSLVLEFLLLLILLLPRVSRADVKSALQVSLMLLHGSMAL